MLLMDKICFMTMFFFISFDQNEYSRHVSRLFLAYFSLISRWPDQLVCTVAIQICQQTSFDWDRWIQYYRCICLQTKTLMIYLKWSWIDFWTDLILPITYNSFRLSIWHNFVGGLAIEISKKKLFYLQTK